MKVLVDYLPEAEREIHAFEQLPPGLESERYWSIFHQWLKDEAVGFGNRTKSFPITIGVGPNRKVVRYCQYPNKPVGALVGIDSIVGVQLVRVAIVQTYQNNHQFDQLIQTGIDRLTKRILKHGKL